MSPTPQERAIAERAGQNPYLRSMTMAEILERQSKVNVLRQAKGKFRPMSTSTPNTEIDEGPKTFPELIKADLKRAADDNADPVWKRGNASGITSVVMLATAMLDGHKVLGCPDVGGLPELLTRLAAIQESKAESAHIVTHFASLAKVNAAANAALDTARREWAKRGEK